MVRISSLATLNDFKLLQMAWIYDTNFPRTFQLARKRRYIEAIRDALPPSARRSEIYARVHAYMTAHCPHGE